MLIRNSLLAGGLILGCAGFAFGAVSAEKAAQLGKNLTLVGAEKAGNKEGTIPDYTGGLATPPSGYQKGSGWRVDPYGSEKPLHTIDARNMGQYADKLSEGVKAMLKKYPTFRLDVYKTHRSVALPKYVLDNTVKHATTAKTANGGLTLTDAHAGYPFPIPQSGFEAMWNHLLRYDGLAFESLYRTYTVDSAGRPTMQVEGKATSESFYYNPSMPHAKDFAALKVQYLGPARRVGEAIMKIDPVDFYNSPLRAWQYLPGQRRVKLAPDMAFDSPSSTYGGIATWDDYQLFNGSMERYNFKIIGKKEMYVPYNTYKFLYGKHDEKEILKPNHINPDLVRWELHRVWVVEATLKSEKRHLYTRQVFYLDEDSWAAVLADKYDRRGQLYRVGLSYLAPSYDALVPFADTFTLYDLVTKNYVLNIVFNKSAMRYINKPFPASYWTADSLAAGGVR
jgi:hypothetical protein